MGRGGSKIGSLEQLQWHILSIYFVMVRQLEVQKVGYFAKIIVGGGQHVIMVAL